MTLRILVFGGTVFLSHETVRAALAAGHEVIAACRGASGSIPEGARWVRFDRAVDDPAGLAEQIGPVDTVIDVARQPSWVAAAAAAFPAAHWVFVSTITVYADPQHRGDDATAVLVDPLFEDADLRERPEAYGPLKVACERLVAERAGAHCVIRPGLIVGPGDPSGRFGYWVDRLNNGGRVLAPSPEAPVQVIDVRDLAGWLVSAAEQRLSGTYDAVGPVTKLGTLLREVGSGVGAVDPQFVWTDDATLAAHDVRPWMGPRSLPLWIPGNGADGLARNADFAADAGLRSRPVAETARDTLVWLGEQPDAPIVGLTREQERAVLAELA